MRSDKNFSTILVFSLVGLFIFYLKIILPAVGMNWRLLGEIYQAIKREENKQELKHEIEKLEERNNYFRYQINHFRTNLFSLHPVSEFYRSIARVAEDHHLKILEISPTVVDDVLDTEALEFQIRFSSGFYAMLKFITQIEEQCSEIHIRELSLYLFRIDQPFIEGRMLLSIHKPEG